MNSILTVLTPATSSDLTTTANVKAELGISGSSEDTQIGRYIVRASAKLATECSRVFGSEVLKETFRISVPCEGLVLRRFPVTAVASVTEDDDVLVAGTDYEIDAQRGILYRLDDDDRIKWGCETVVVQYTAGYSLPGGAPSDLEGACIALVKQARSSATRDPMAKRVEIPGVRTTDFWVGSLPGQSDLPPEVEAVVESYKAYRL